MKSRLCGCLLGILLLFSFLSLAKAEPADAGGSDLRWLRLYTPQNGAAGNYAIMNNSEVNRIAIGSDGSTIYSLDSQNKRLYKSSDGGYIWDDLSARVGGGANWTEVAIARDDAKIVAVVTDSGTRVWISVDGGANFSATGLLPLAPGEVIRCIDISPVYGTSREMMVGTSTGAAGGTIFVMSLGVLYFGWTNMGSGGIGWAAANVFACAYSPKYSADRVVLLIAANTQDTYLYGGQRNVAGQTVTWNTWDGYPVEIARPGGDSPPSPLAYASLALPFDYFGSEPPLRRVYASWSDGVGGNTNDDVYRLDDTQVVCLYAGGGAEFVAASLAYYGSRDSGKLLAGRQFSAWALPMPPSVQVRCSLNPQAMSPIWRDSRKPPTGPNEAQVAWSPDGKIAYCGTSTTGGVANDESAFSRSVDDGLSWNQTGLIDTVIASVNDFEPTATGDTLFMTTVNAGAGSPDSLWRTHSPLKRRWERVLARSIKAGGSGDNPQVRIAPDYATSKAVWFLNVDPLLAFQELLILRDGGNTYVPGSPNIILVDLAVEDKDTICGLDSKGIVAKSVDGGWAWGVPVNTGLGSGYSIATAYTGSTPDNPKGHVIVGGRGTGDYDVAYSTDGGSSFALVTMPLPPPRDNTLVIASSGYKSDGTILAMTFDGIYAWSIYAGEDKWEQWGFTAWGGWAYGFGFTGMVISRNYTAYASVVRTLPWGVNGVGRWFYPNLLADLDPDVTFQVRPRGLKLSGGLIANEPVTLWAADARPYNPPVGGIWCYTDPLIWLGPAPTVPLSQARVDYDPVSGRGGEVALKWEPRFLSDGYRIQVAQDEFFSQIAIDIGSFPFYYPSGALAPALILPAGGGTISDRAGNTWTVAALSAGKTYYWRVRVQSVATGDFLWSPWSWYESFAVTAGLRVRTASPGLLILSPKIGASAVPCSPAFSWSPMSGAAEYEFVLSRDAAMTDIVVTAKEPTSAYKYEGKLERSRIYFWRVRATKPALSVWSGVGIFTVTEEPSTPAAERAAEECPLMPIWVPVVIGIGGALIIGVIKLISRLS